jgi:hypothetical protein
VTKSRHQGRNEVTDEAKRRAIQERKSLAAVLKEMLAEAKAAKDTKTIKKVEEAQKFVGSRNIRKRRGAK